ncbi:MAG: ribonuclease R, partial [Bacteroidota bacterium]
MGKKKKNRSKAKLKERLREEILDFFTRHPTKSYNYKQVSNQLNINNKHKRRLVMDTLAELERAEYLDEVRKGRYQIRLKSSILEGRIEFTAEGLGYLVSDEIDGEVYILGRNLHHALPGDRVRVRLFAHQKNKALEGEVIEIIKRSKTQFVGTVSRSKNFAFLVTASR